MPTWDMYQRRIHHRVDYVGLRDLETVVINDDNPFSDDYFNIIEFPTVLTAGKNLFKMKANANTLVRNSRVHIEILDFNNNPIYYEVLKYAEVDGTRVITIWVYNNLTPPGVARVYVGGRARINPRTNETFPFSQNINDENYYNLPNVLWSRTVSVAPNQLNSTEIIWRDGRYPSATIQERAIPYMQPINLQNTLKVISGSDNAYVMIQPVTDDPMDPAMWEQIQNNIDEEGSYNAVETAYVLNTFVLQYGVDTSDWSQTLNEVNAQEGQSLNSTSQYTLGGFSRVVVPSGSNLEFTPDHINGVITVKDPIIMGMAGVFVNSYRHAFPATQLAGNPISCQANNIDSNENVDVGPNQGIGPQYDASETTLPQYFTASATAQADLNTYLNNPQGYTGSYVVNNTLYGGSAFVPPDLFPDWPNDPYESKMMQLSGSYRFGILNVENSTTAYVYMVGGPINQTDITTGEFRIHVASADITSVYPACGLAFPILDGGWARDTIYPSTNVTMSFLSPYELAFTPQTQSFGDIILRNIEPDAGDVYKVKTEFKPGGQFGEWDDLGDTIIEQVEIFVDSGSFETYVDGTQIEAQGLSPAYRRVGFPTSQAEVDDGTLITAQEVNEPQNENSPDLFYDPTSVMSAIRIQVAQDFGTTGFRWGYFHPKKSFSSTIRVTEGTSYMVRFNCAAVDDKISSDPLVPLPRIDMWVSGSVQGVNTVYTNVAYQISPGNDIITSDEQYPELRGFGTKVVTVEQESAASGSITRPVAIFTSPVDQWIHPTIIVRRGTWHIGSISIKTMKETGFTPNFMRIFKRIPTAYVSQPCSFRFRFFDYQSTEARLRAVIFPVMFVGENSILAGPNNLLTGSLYISNEVGTGIQGSGEGSGFLRTVGFKGFTSASTTDGATNSGFMLYSGSVLRNETDDYISAGTGLDMVYDSSSYFSFNTAGPRRGVKIKTPRFYLGSGDGFISGSHDKIEISSSAFHLTRDGKVIIPSLTTRATPSSPAGDFVVDGNISASGNIVANEYHVRTVTSSVMFSDGNTQFGDSLLDTHSFSGSIVAVTMSGGRIEGGSF